MKTRGGAVVELVLWTGLFVAMIAGSFEIARVVVWRMRLISAARLGATLVGTGRIESDIIEREVRTYFQQWPGWQSASLQFSVGRFLGVPSAPFYKLMSTDLTLRLANATLTESVRCEQEESS